MTAAVLGHPVALPVLATVVAAAAVAAAVAAAAATAVVAAVRRRHQRRTTRASSPCGLVLRISASTVTCTALKTKRWAWNKSKSLIIWGKLWENCVIVCHDSCWWLSIIWDHGICRCMGEQGVIWCMYGTMGTKAVFDDFSVGGIFGRKSQDYVYGKGSTRVLGKKRKSFDTWK